MEKKEKDRNTKHCSFFEVQFTHLELSISIGRNRLGFYAKEIYPAESKRDNGKSLQARYDARLLIII